MVISVDIGKKGLILTIIFLLTNISVYPVLSNRLVFPSENLNIDMKARYNPSDTWKDSIYGLIDDEIEFKLITTDGNSVQAIMAHLPPVLDYIQGSANPSYDDYQVEGGIETLIWNNFYDTITFKAKIVAPGEEEATAEVVSTAPPYMDNDTLSIEAAYPLQVDADGPYYGNVSQEIQFYGFASGGFSPLSWHWDFGDGATSNKRFPTHSYSQPGDYTVTLTVTDKYGYTDEDTTTAHITAETAPPTADAGGPYQGHVGESIQFDGSNSHDNDENGCCIETYDWKFYDGDSWHNDIGPNPSYTYDKAGTYTVTLRVHDNEGGTDEDTTTVDIREKGKVDIYVENLRLEPFSNTQPIKNILAFTMGNNGNKVANNVYLKISYQKDGKYVTIYERGKEPLSPNEKYDVEYVLFSCGIIDIIKSMFGIRSNGIMGKEGFNALKKISAFKVEITADNDISLGNNVAVLNVKFDDFNIPPIMLFIQKLIDMLRIFPFILLVFSFVIAAVK